MNINVIGLGKLGYPMSLFLSSSGYKVNCYDKNITIYEKIKNYNYLNKEENISDYAEYNKNLFYFDNVQDSFKNTFVSFITVPTPSKLDGSFNLDIVKESLDDLGLYLQNNSSNNSTYIINICSTVSPYSCENELIPYMEDKFNLKEGIDFVMVYNPYFVALGSVIKTLRNPDFILVGVRDKKKIKKFLDLYKILYSHEANFKILSLTEAEITKICVNTFLTLKISFANIMQLLGFKDKNLSTNKILDAIGEDSRIGKKFLKSGLPYGGPCLPRDNFAVINFLNKLKIQSDLNESSEAINNNYTSYLYDQIDFLEEKNIKKITFMGMGYKSNTDCVEGSVSLKLIDYCIEKKFKILLYDFYINTNYKNVKKYSNLNELISNSDVIFIPYKDQKFNELFNYSNKKIIIFDMFDQFENIQDNIIVTKNLKNIDLTFLEKKLTVEKNQKIVNLKI